MNTDNTVHSASIHRPVYRGLELPQTNQLRAIHTIIRDGDFGDRFSGTADSGAAR